MADSTIILKKGLTGAVSRNTGKEHDFYKFLLIISFLLFSFNLSYSEEYADPVPIEKDEDGFLFKYDGREAVFIQKIFWNKLSHAVVYKMILKDSEDRTIIEVETEDNFREFSLPAGDYYYKIVPYNILGQPEGETRWIPLQIKKAYLPVIFALSVETIYVEDFYNDPIIILGRDFTDEVTVHLKDLTDTTRRLIKAEIKEVSSTRIAAQFKEEDFKFGDYELIITNPGNVYAVRNISVKFAKPVDIFSTTSYLPMINSKTGDFNQLISDIFNPFGIRVDLSVFPVKLKYGFIGLTLSGDANFFNETRAVALNCFIIKASLNASYVYFFNRYVGILPKIGGGMAFTGMIFDFGNDDINKKYFSADPYFTTGVGVVLRVFRGVSIFTGFDYVQLFYKDSTLGFFQPFVGVGYYF